MFKIPIQELDKIMNDHFGSGDAQIQSTNDEAELQEQPRGDDVDEEERDDPPDWKENESTRPISCFLNKFEIAGFFFYFSIYLQFSFYVM